MCSCGGIQQRTDVAMAVKLDLLLLAGLLMAASASSVAGAGRHDGPPLESSLPSMAPVRAPHGGRFWVELVVRNMAQGSVSFQLASPLGSGTDEVAGEAVVAVTGQGAVMGPVEVGVEHPVVAVGVTVKAHARSDPVKKVVQIDLVKYFGEVQEGGRRSVVVTAVESWRLKSGKYLVIRVGRQRWVGVSFKL